MAQNMQKRIMQALADRLETDKFEVVIDTEYANTGTIRAVPEGQFTSKYSLHFQFDSGYCTFKHGGHNGSGLSHHPAATRGYHIYYDQGEAKFTSMLEAIVEFLEGGME